MAMMYQTPSEVTYHETRGCQRYVLVNITAQQLKLIETKVFAPQ